MDLLIERVYKGYFKYDPNYVITWNDIIGMMQAENELMLYSRLE